MNTLTLDMEHFTFESFLEQLSKNPGSVFTNPEQRKWLKIDLVTSINEWHGLFKEYGLEKLGEMYHFKMKNNNSAVEYYVYEIKPCLLVFFSMSKREAYKSTLKSFIRRTRGMTNMWLPFDSFKTTVDFVKSKYTSSHIYSFTARRPWSSEYPAKIRGEISRSIHYSGSDADHSLSELQEIYGVLPTIIDFQIGSDKVRITNDGFILIRGINFKILHIVEEIIDQAIVEPIRLGKISKQVSYKQEKMWNKFKISEIMSGKIIFNANPSLVTINQLFQDFNEIEIERNENVIDLPNFSFIDTNISEEPLNYSATAVDEDNGNVFGISGNSKHVILVPKHETTFESFINFYRLINETIDKSSNLCLFNEQCK